MTMIECDGVLAEIDAILDNRPYSHWSPVLGAWLSWSRYAALGEW